MNQHNEQQISGEAVKMEAMCTGCLSTDRKLHYIYETEYYHVYTQILNEIPVYDLTQVCIRICWECCARLRRMQLFKLQVQQNYSDLMQHIIPHQGKSTLSTHSQYILSFPDGDAMKMESDDVVIKSESRTFAAALDVQVIKDTAEPLEKKSPKTKRKRSKKLKVKKKRKKEDSIDIDETENGLEDEDDIQDNANIDAKESHIEENTTEDNNEESHLKENLDKEDKLLPDSSKEEPVTKKVVRRRRSVSALPERPQCQECGKVFSSKKTYRYHLNVLHKGQNQYPCPRCGKVYQWKSNLGRHMRSHKAVDDGELFCALCDKSFASVATYRQHLRISRRHVPETDFSFACESCGKRFVNKTRLRDHIDWEHLQKIKFRCQMCEKPFKCHTSLYVHLQNVHTAHKRRDNLCHVCGKSYQNAAKLKYHITAMHSGDTPYRCGECGASFGWYSSLYRHTREVHYKMKGLSKKGKKAKQGRVSPPPQHYPPSLAPI